MSPYGLYFCIKEVPVLKKLVFILYILYYDIERNHSFTTFRSREEILIWKEKQAQVKAAQRKQETEGDSVNTADSKTVVFCKNKKLIRGILKRETWTKIAGLLIKQVPKNASFLRIFCCAAQFSSVASSLCFFYKFIIS